MKTPKITKKQLVSLFSSKERFLELSKLIEKVLPIVQNLPEVCEALKDIKEDEKNPHEIAGRLSAAADKLTLAKGYATKAISFLAEAKFYAFCETWGPTPRVNYPGQAAEMYGFALTNARMALNLYYLESESQPEEDFQNRFLITVLTDPRLYTKN